VASLPVTELKRRLDGRKKTATQALSIELSELVVLVEHAYPGVCN
jgi:hypothetical protein